TARFCLRANTLVQRLPAAHEPLLEVVGNEAERGVAEADERATLHLLEAVLNVRDDRHRHEERSGDLEQRGPLDRLYVAPEVAVVVAQIAKPAAAGPGLEHHGHRHAADSGVAGPHLLQERF